MEKEQEHLLFTDGSSLGNPGPGGWGSVLVLSGSRIVELGGMATHTTNNRMELIALIEGLKRMKKESEDIHIYTDSSYVHKGATEWSAGWKQRGWKTITKTPVENRDIWEEALTLLDERKKFGHIKWTRIPGHSGVLGNERCDKIATGFANGRVVDLYEGDIGQYAIDILDISIDDEMAKARSSVKARSHAKAHSYLSLVGGVAKRHMTWPECEKRVKGKSTVKYKKTLSAVDEASILRAWGATL